MNIETDTRKDFNEANNKREKNRRRKSWCKNINLENIATPSAPQLKSVACASCCTRSNSICVLCMYLLHSTVIFQTLFKSRYKRFIILAIKTIPLFCWFICFALSRNWIPSDTQALYSIALFLFHFDYFEGGNREREWTQCSVFHAGYLCGPILLIVCASFRYAPRVIFRHYVVVHFKT